MGPHGLVWANIKTGRSPMAHDHFQTPPDPQKGFYPSWVLFLDVCDRKCLHDLECNIRTCPPWPLCAVARPSRGTSPHNVTSMLSRRMAWMRLGTLTRPPAKSRRSPSANAFLAGFARTLRRFFGFFGSFIAPFGVRRGFKMILSHRAPSSFNMSSYRATWTHFRPNFIFADQKISDPEKSKLFLKCKSSHLAILINIWHI